MSSFGEKIYDSGCLRIQKDAAGDFFLKTKWRFFALIIATIVAIVIAFCFGVIFFYAIRELFGIGLKNWKKDLLESCFGGFGLTLATLCFRAAWWDCIPKTLEVNHAEKTCFVRTYLFLCWKIPFNELQAIGLKIDAGRLVYSGCLCLFKSQGMRYIRLCTTSQSRSHQQAYKDGMEVAEIISSALNIPVIYYTKKKGWPKIEK